MINGIILGLSGFLVFVGFYVWYYCKSALLEEMNLNKSLIGQIAGIIIMFMSVLSIIWFSTKCLSYVLVGTAINLFIIGVIFGVAKFIKFLEK